MANIQGLRKTLSSPSRDSLPQGIRLTLLESCVILHVGPRRLARPRTPVFQAGNTGSNPVGGTTFSGSLHNPGNFVGTPPQEEDPQIFARGFAGSFLYYSDVARTFSVGAEYLPKAA